MQASKDGEPICRLQTDLGTMVGQQWGIVDQQWHINIRVIKAAFSICMILLQGHRVQILSNNSTVVSYLRYQWGKSISSPLYVGVENLDMK